jgi:oxalate---CoA ligase
MHELVPPARSHPGGPGSRDYPPGTLHELLARHARRDPASAAVLAPGRRPLSFAGLLDQIETIRTALNARGLGRGDRIALLIDRGPEAAVAVLGVASCATCAPLNAAAPLKEIEQGLAQVKAKALLTLTRANDELRGLARRLGIVLLDGTLETSAAAGRFQIEGEGRTGTARHEPAMPDDLALLMRTSGTTARPKLVPISHRNILARTSKIERLFELTPADRCLNLMPLCYTHGLNSGLIGPLAAGGSSIFPPAVSADTFLACLRDLQPTWYTAGFTYHQAILEWLEQREAVPTHRLRFARVGSGPLPARVRLGLERILGIPVLERYSTTETGLITANPLSGQRKPGTVGTSAEDDVAILGEHGHLVPAGTVGEVVVRSARVFGGYENDPEANQRALRNGWYRTSDRGCMDADGYLKLLGRLDDEINRGGEKIAPPEVDDALLEHPAVARAVSFPLPHPTLHQEVAAAVVLQRGRHASESELRQFLSERLAAFKIPRRIVITDALPQGPTGKLSRKAMAEHFGLAAGAAPSRSAEPRTTVQQALLELWRDVLKRDDIGPDDNFFLSGGDSLTAVDLLCRIEAKLHYRVPLTLLIAAPTAAELEAKIDRGTLGAIDDIVRIHEGGRRRPLFAICGRYGHVIRLLPLLDALGPDQPCFALQPPGLDWTSVGCTTIPQMAAFYISRIRQIQTHGPYRLLGGSFGGLVVFEMALQLQAAGEQVEFLGLIDTTPPQCFFANEVDVPELRAPLPQPQHGSWIEAVNDRLAETHVSARRSYVLDVGAQCFAGELTFFYCTGEPVAAQRDRRRLWQQLAPGGFQLVPLPGLHGTIHHEPQFTVLKDLLNACHNDGMLPTSDPADVFDREYHLQGRKGREIILGAAGEQYVIETDRVPGHVDLVEIAAGNLRIDGWAAGPDQRPAQTIAVFLDGRYLGWGACGVARPDVARGVAATLQYAGFVFRFSIDASHDHTARPRLFVLSPDGRAGELRHPVLHG